jgi:phosphosulfolactate phosphohydrolase-like enzyme
MDVDGFRLNDGALLALDFAERHEENVYETLKRSRAGRWFVENDRMDAFDFVADTGASGLVPEVVGGKLRRANEHESYVGDAEWGRILGERP